MKRAFLARNLHGRDRNLMLPSRLVDDIRVINHPENFDADLVDAFIPPLDLPLHSDHLTSSSNMAAHRFPDILRLDNDFDDVKHSLKEVYGVYDYDYVNHPPYGPTAARMDSPDYTDKEVDAIIEKYLGDAVYGPDPTEPKPPPMCPCCRTVNDHNRRHGRRKTSPIRLPYIPDSPTVMLPRIAHSPPPSSRTPHSRTVRFNNLVEYTTYTPEPAPAPELFSETETLPALEPEVTDSRRIYLTKPQRSMFFNEFGMGNGYSTNRAEDLVSASYKYNESMEKLGEKLKAFD